MRAERSWYFGTLAGAFATLAAFVISAREHATTDVRASWLGVAPAFVAIVALLGLALASWRPAARGFGKVMAGMAVGALATHALFALLVPRASDEPALAPLSAFAEIAGWALLPLGVLAAVGARTPPRTARAILWVLFGVALALAARLVHGAWSAPEPMRVGLAVAWTSFVLVGGLAVVRLLSRLVAHREAPLSPGATPP